MKCHQMPGPWCVLAIIRPIFNPNPLDCILQTYNCSHDQIARYEIIWERLRGPADAKAVKSLLDRSKPVTMVRGESLITLGVLNYDSSPLQSFSLYSF